MERETELVTELWDSSVSENGGLRNDLSPLLPESDENSKPLEDDGVDVSLKDWQLGLRNYSVERKPMAVAPSRPFKGSVRTRFTPIDPKVEANAIAHSRKHSSPERFETAPTSPRSPRARAASPSASPTRLESSNDADSSLDNLGFPDGHGHPLHNVNEASGIASPETTVGEIGLKDAKSDKCGSRLGRGRSLRVSFTDESETSRSPSPPEILNRSVLRSRTTHASNDCHEYAPVPLMQEKPSTLGVVGPREGIVTGDKPRGSPLPLPEIETLHQNGGTSASGDRGAQFRHPSVQARRSLDSIGEGSKYDSSSNLVTGPPATSGREDTSTSICNAPSFLLRCNARRQHDEEADDDGNENVKVGMLCGGPFSDSKISGDFVRLLSKLCRLSVPLPKQCIPKASQVRRSEVVRSSSIPPEVCSWETQNSSEDYVVIGRQHSLKLLCERCSSETTPPYSVHKPRKIRDHEHHQHFYKTISKTLDQKLRS